MSTPKVRSEGAVTESLAQLGAGEGVGVASHPKLIEGEVRVIGRRWSPRVHAIKAFLARTLGLETEPDARSYDLVIGEGARAVQFIHYCRKSALAR